MNYIKHGSIFTKLQNIGTLIEYPKDYVVKNTNMILDDGTIKFTLYYPKANQVTLRYGTHQILMCKEEDEWCGFVNNLNTLQRVTVYVDGNEVLDSTLPIAFSENRLINYIDSCLCDNMQIPHGSVLSDYIFSRVTNRLEHINVYLPPDYFHKPDLSYPVLYLQHGHGENENAWIKQGQINFIYDELLYKKIAHPAIVVMCNGMMPYEDKDTIKLGFIEHFESFLVNEVIPYIDHTYRTIKKREYRAMAGLSMGSLQTSVVTLRHQDLFASAGIFSGFVQNPLSDYQEHIDKSLLSTYGNKINLFFRSIGNLDEYMSYFKSDDELLTSYNIKSYRVIYQGGHEWNVWQKSILDFLPMLFRMGE